MSTGKTIRLRTAIKRRHPDWSQSYILKLIADGRVSVNGKPAGRQVWVKDGDAVLVDTAGLKTRLVPNANVACRLLTLTEDYILLAKSPGVHSVAQDFEETNSVSNWLLTIDPRLFDLDPLECGLGHRLDFETSGVMVAGRNKAALAHLEGEFRAHRVRKEYVCLVDNAPPAPGVYAATAGKHPKSSKRVRVSQDADRDVIRTEVLSAEKLAHAWRVRVRLITGYRHQIRAHLAYLGAPIRGDTVYGGRSAERLFLHAEMLEFRDRHGAILRAECPADFASQA